MKKKLTIGILAHVDAGKTTLSEALLYLSGKIRTLGRVDHKNTYLDTNDVERERGITVFSKQARFSSENCDFILLDTPGHVDLSAETERTLSLLDYAILVVSGADGVQNHTRTLWQLLEYYKVPVFVFVNKSDIAIKLKEEIEEELSSSLSPSCVAFYEERTKKQLDEKLALICEDFLESYLADEPIDDCDIAALISERKLFPCVFGSALRMTGIEHLLSVVDKYTLSPDYPSLEFGARVYKIARAGAIRLTYMKITGGTLTARDELSYITQEGKKLSEKVSQIRLYSGEKYDQADSVSAGEICAVSGLTATYVGQGLGQESDTCKPVLEPVLSYRIVLPSECDPNVYFAKLKELEEEEPSLHLYWNDELSQIEARLMGEIQIDIIKRLVMERFSVSCSFDTGRILYKERIAERAVGVGHFEPLRHYAEVHLLLEPQPKGSGLIFESDIPENSLALNWQRLILTHLYEKMHRGTLVGAALTDTKITLLAGKAHLKHTEGGDFREATYRAVRHGLMKGGCVLLEPYYKFRIEVPKGYVGRVMSDLQARFSEFEIESATEEISVLSGKGPVSELHGYIREIISFTGGKGRMSCTSDGYYPCHNADDIVAQRGYDPESDISNPPHSVFCANGAGFVVPWQEVDGYKHLDVSPDSSSASEVIPKASGISRKYNISNEELEAIMLREFGPIKRRRYSEPKVIHGEKPQRQTNSKKRKQGRQLTIIDGYNLIFAWDELRATAEKKLDDARSVLMDILSNYVAFTKNEVILVFDAYLVKGNVGEDFTKDGYRVVFTRQDETADAYIERMMYELGPDCTVRVVSGDSLVQSSAVSSGILRTTAKEFADEVITVGNEIRSFLKKLSDSKNG